MMMPSEVHGPTSLSSTVFRVITLPHATCVADATLTRPLLIKKVKTAMKTSLRLILKIFLLLGPGHSCKNALGPLSRDIASVSIRMGHLKRYIYVFDT